MAKLYIAVVTKNKNPPKAIIRDAGDGVSDLEFALGMRIYRGTYFPSRILLENTLRVEGCRVIGDVEEWREMLRDMTNDDGVETNHFKSTYVPYDKWDQRPIIW